MSDCTVSHFVSDLANGGELVGALSSRKLPFEFILDSLNLLLLLKLLLAQGFVECELIIVKLNGEECTAFPAAVWPLIA